MRKQTQKLYCYLLHNYLIANSLPRKVQTCEREYMYTVCVCGWVHVCVCVCVCACACVWVGGCMESAKQVHQNYHTIIS